jgi:hypothetical protein
MSFANNQVFGDDVTKSYPSAVYPLGTERLVLGSQTNVGDQVWIFVHNNTGAPLALNSLVRHALTSPNGTVSGAGTAVNPSALVGVVQGAALPGVAAADGSFGPYGWVLKRGMATVLVGAGYAQDQSLISSTTTAGAVDSLTTATTPTFGYGVGAVVGSAAQVYISLI